MANGNGEQAEQVQGTKNTRKGVTAEDYRLYDTLEDAQAHRPEGKENWACWQVTDPNGRRRFTWAPYGERVAWNVLEADRWSILDTANAPTKVEVEAMLAALSPADRAALLAQYVPAGKGKNK
jgi:YD repeat-containing protein